MPLKTLASGYLRVSGARLSRFFAWWRGELESARADWSLRKGERGRILCTPEELVLSRIVPSGSEPIARVSRTPPLSDLPHTIQTLLSQAAQTFRRLEIILPTEATLSRQVHLPVAVGRRLREAVGFQLERLMPLKPELVYFGCAVISRDEVRRRLLVEIVETRRGLADTLVSTALAAGIGRVLLLSSVGQGEQRTIPLLDRASSRAESNQSKLDRRLGWAAAALAVAVAIVALCQYHFENTRLAVQVQAFKVRAASADKLRDALEGRVERIQFLADRVSGPDAAAILAELTRLLPNDAWVFQYQAEGDQLHIAGFAKDASALSAQLSKSGLFKDVSLRSAIKAPGTEGERFDIAIRVRSPARS